jgi:WD40 repeat protein
MKSLRLLPLFLCLLVVLSPAVAQETIESGWPIEERCLNESTPPPDDWTFPSAILMTGHYGIHGVTDAWETPRVLVFEHPRELPGAVFSPDGKWYARPMGNFELIYNVNGNAANVQVNEISVSSTINADEVYRVPWNLSYFTAGQPQPTLVWHDVEHIIYMDQEGNFSKINPFIGDIQSFDIEILPRDVGTIFFQSPDWSRVLLKDNTVVFDQYWTLYDPFDASEYLQYFTLAQYPQISWSPDSTQFVTETEFIGEDNLINQLELFDKDGDHLETIFHQSNGQRIVSSFGLFENISWSPDGRYLAFVTTTFANPVINLYIADMQEKRVYDTCIETSDGLAWSPDGKMLAMMDFYDYKPHRPVMVLDLDTWAMHTVAYHDGSVIGWRGD